MTFEHIGYCARMGPRLQKLVEDQLLNDLHTYGVNPHVLTIDWSDACGEGHCTDVLDGDLEELSSIVVVDPADQPTAEGWMDFIHGGGENPLFVFWLYLRVNRNGAWHEVKNRPYIPAHVWSRLPEDSKRLCTKSDSYDARWKDDPLVVAWSRSQAR